MENSEVTEHAFLMYFCFLFVFVFVFVKMVQLLWVLTDRKFRSDRVLSRGVPRTAITVTLQHLILLLLSEGDHDDDDDNGDEYDDDRSAITVNHDDNDDDHDDNDDHGDEYDDDR